MFVARFCVLLPAFAVKKAQKRGTVHLLLVRRGLNPRRQFLFWEFGCVPATAQGADQGDCVDELAGLKVDGGALILDESGFGGEDFKVAGDPAFVALSGDFKGVPR